MLSDLENSEPVSKVELEEKSVYSGPDMNDINLEETGCIDNYDTLAKNLCTDEDHN